ncbi:MAG: LPS export ABC transporter periplasmic protein LptC [Pseudomonadales bacterium]|nr:LPS export ABC transporter periplasmic protein LptC [Pseudomonadales bacterium]
MDLKNSASLLGIFIMLACLAYFYGYKSSGERTLTGIGSSQAPDYRVTGAESMLTDDNGIVIRQVTSQSLDHFSQGVEHSLLQTPQVVMFQDGLPAWQLDAEQGTSLSNNSHLILKQNVVGKRLTTLAREKLTISTSLLDAYPDLQAISTEVAVHMVSSQGDTDALGMDASLKTGELNLHHNVRGTYVLTH